MDITFFVQNDPDFHKKPRIRKYARFFGGAQTFAPDGRIVTAVDTIELVDEGIIAQHPREHARFIELFNDYEKELLKKATEKPGVPVYLPQKTKAELLAEESAKKKAAGESAKKKADDDAASGAQPNKVQ